ncbi:uncharacterized protein LOC121845915 isoform X2 [Oncorhynchus tshawytscha]|uniref:uncharacterized protein LOC121845915 isoform X2 n=1 Tax=Oncorhynchus tshawytscha TaxID=74940 RepID=UPI001C3C6452|nr:uncharacterized protein LOC121845915 isoform X2 [Oncorhynchus tshawytscha]
MCGGVSRLALLLVLWGLCTANDVTQEKTLETGGADSTLLCPNQTLTDILTVVCHKNRVISGGHECRVSQDFETNHTNSTCDPRVTLQTENDSVFLHITNTQPSDEGNYTCDCTHDEGNSDINIHISVNGTQVQQATDNRLFYWGMISGVAACVAVLVFGGVIMRKIHLRRTQLQVSGTVNEEEPQDNEPYNTFTRRDNGIYSTLQLPHPNP